MLRFHTCGDAFTRGRQQGLATGDLTRGWMEPALEELRRRHGAGSLQALLLATRSRIDRWIHQWQAVFPAGVEECRGIAQGLGWPWTQYTTALCHHRLGGELPQCTLVGWRADDGRPLFGKTDDIGPHQRGLNVMEIARPDDGHPHVHFHFAGTPWTVAGANAPGLMMGMTGIPGPMLDTEGLFSLLALHTVLPRCACVAEALTHLGPLPLHAYGFSLMLSDSGGEMALVEKTGAGMTVSRPGPEALVHTNHILDPAFAARNPRQGEPLRTNSRHRWENARRRAAAGATLQQILADRAAVGPVCQQGEGGLHTDFALLFDAVGRRLTLWAGYPAEVQAEHIDLADLFD